MRFLRVGSSLFGAFILALSGIAMPVAEAVAQTAPPGFFVAHKERLARLSHWARTYPELEIRVSEIIVRAEDLPPGSTEALVTRVVFQDQVFFAYDSADLSNVGLLVLGSLVDLLRQEPTIPDVLVAGHTDSKGTEAYNRGLSLRRASSVARDLVRSGIDSRSLAIAAMGEVQPLVSNATENTRGMNRRIEIFLSNRDLANEVAAARLPVDPCHRNDHPDASAAERCRADRADATIYRIDRSGAVRSTGRAIVLR